MIISKVLCSMGDECDDYLEFLEDPLYLTALKKKEMSVYLVYQRTVGRKNIYKIQLDDPSEQPHSTSRRTTSR